MFADGFKAHQLSKVELSDPNDPSKKYSLLGDITLTLKSHLDNYETLKLQIPLKEIPPFLPTLSREQLLTLWLIGLSSLPMFARRGAPGWYLAETLKMPRSQFTRDVVSPLRKMRLIGYQDRLSKKDNGKRHRGMERAFFFERINLRNTFFILLDDFKKYYLNNLTSWNGTKHLTWEEMTTKNQTAELWFFVLAHLQRGLDEYETSAQWFIDMGVNPPQSLQFGTSKPDKPAIVFTSVGPISFS